MDKFLVSIIIPCYNQAQYLSEALQSVLEQTYTNWECIIINDGSSDDIEVVAKKWLQVDKRLQYISSINKGVSAARNLGISNAKGEFILPLDADDKINSKYIELAIDAFENDKKLSLVYCKAMKFGVVEEEWILPEFSHKELAANNLIFCTAMFRKKDWELVGGYDVNMTKGLEDWEFWIALLKNNKSVERLDYYGFFYRIKEKSRQVNLKSNDYQLLFDYLSVKHADFFINHYGSFMQLKHNIAQLKLDTKLKLSSKKFVLHLFFRTFFKITLFSKYNND